MAKTKVKTQIKNPDRPNRKAWGKHHNPTVEQVRAAQERRGRQAEKRAKRVPVIRHERGLSVTMPDISWDWMEQAMVARWPNTRKVRVIDTYIAMTKRGGADVTDGLPMAVEPSPEAKSSRKAISSSRRDGK